MTERARENEVTKVARLKRGLLALSDAYLQLAERTQLVYSAHRDIVSELPDMDAQHLHTAKFTGTCTLTLAGFSHISARARGHRSLFGVVCSRVTEVPTSDTGPLVKS